MPPVRPGVGPNYVVSGIMALLGMVSIGGVWAWNSSGGGKFSDTGGDHIISIKASSDEAANRVLSIPSMGSDKYIATTANSDGSTSGGGFDSITSGSNTTATMTVGTGASIVKANSGIIEATKLKGSGSTSDAVDLATGEVAGLLPAANLVNSGVHTGDATGTFPAITLATVTVGKGGTGITSGTSGGIPYFSGTTTIASSGALAANQIVLGGGAGTTPATLGSLGTTTTVLHGNAAGAPTFGAVVIGDTSGIAASGTNADITSTTALNTITGTAASTLALVATSHAADTVTSYTGAAITITSGVGVADTDTVGATASGGAITITAGSGARNTSGTGVGGALNLLSGASVGNTNGGVITIGEASLNNKMVMTGGTAFDFTLGGSACVQISNTGPYLYIEGSSSQLKMSNNSWALVSQSSANVVATTGTIQFGLHRRRAATQTVTDSASLTADDTLSVTLIAGRKYSFRVVYYFTTVATSGVQVDMGGGAATFTSFQGDIEIDNLSTFGVSGGGEMTASTTAIGVTALGTSTKVEINGGFVCNAGGTFKPRFAQNAEGVGAESVIAKIDSHMLVWDMP